RYLLTDAPLLELGARASEARFARWPDNVVTFVIDSNPNYTNVCVTDCQFCAFYRKPGDREAWTLTVDEVLAKVESAATKGATTVLLQGGHNPALPLDYYLTLVRETRKRFPQVTPPCSITSPRSASSKTSAPASRRSCRGHSSPATRCSRSGSSNTKARTRICVCSPPRACTSTTFRTSRRRGSPRARPRARSRCTSAPTTGAARCSRKTSTRRRTT